MAADPASEAGSCLDISSFPQVLVKTDLVLSPSQVKVDKSCALEHVTRDRVRGGQRRRPPTRIHLKEVSLCPQLGQVGGQLSLGPQLLRVAARLEATFFLRTPEW